MTVFFNDKSTINKGDEKQSNLLRNILEFDSNVRPKPKIYKEEKSNAFLSINALYEGQ